MNIGNLFRIALKALSNNKLRGFLTMLGIIIGVGAVITMLAIGQGSKKSIQAEISEMGSNMIMISPGGDRRGGGVRMSSDDMQTLKVKDFEDISSKCSFVDLISPTVNASGQAVYGSNNTPTSMYGVNRDYLDIRSYKVQDGDVFSDQDIKTAAKVCLVGATVVENLFPDGENPVGKVIRYGSIPFKIIGVLESKGSNTMGMDQDDLLIAPYTTVMKRIQAVTYLQGITCSAISEDYTDQAVDEISAVLRENHKIKAGADDDFEIRSQQELSSMMTSTSDLMSTLLAAVAAISLIVGGIGIMNIMYVSVTERTKEIGLRMSIGARSRDILAQFLIEATLLSVVGGLIGVVVGVGASLLVKVLLSYPIFIQPWSIVMSFAVCTIIGIFFGWYPARKASNLDPIEALRYE
ncbi:MAG: ABC transporter permease [Bacteroidales bacterium]|nr:ABC transporter permease [Bacteroidales bacterium]